MGLKLNLKPHEKCIIGGAAVQNGNKMASLLIANQTTILREKHIMTEEKADTLAKQIYFVVQLIYLDGGIDNSGTAGLFMDTANITYTLAELATVQFVGFALGATQLASGEIVPIGPLIPEASTYINAGSVVLFAFIHHYRRRRKRSVLEKSQ